MPTAQPLSNQRRCSVRIYVEDFPLKSSVWRGSTGTSGSNRYCAPLYQNAGNDSGKPPNMREGVISACGESLHAEVHRFAIPTNARHVRGSSKLLVCAERQARVYGCNEPSTQKHHRPEAPNLPRTGIPIVQTPNPN